MGWGHVLPSSRAPLGGAGRRRGSSAPVPALPPAPPQGPRCDAPKAPGGTPDTGVRVPPWPVQDLPLAPGRGVQESRRGNCRASPGAPGTKARRGLSVGRKEGAATQPPAEATPRGPTGPTTPYSPRPSAHQAPARPHLPASPRPSAPPPSSPRAGGARAAPPLLVRYQHTLPKPGPAPGHPAPPSQPPPSPARLLPALVISEIPPCRRRSEAGRRVPRERQAER